MMKRTGLALLIATLAVGSMAIAQGGPPQGGPPDGGPGGPGGRGGMMMFGGPGGPGGNKLMLLQRNDVQTDLKLTDEQKTQLAELQKKQRGQMRGGPGGGPGGPGGPGGGGPGGPGGQGGPGGDPDEMRAQMEKRMKEQDAQINAILTADQQKRLKEISVQMAGNAAILQPDIQKELGITEDQQSAIHAALDAQREQMDEMRENAGGPGEGGDRQAMMTAMKKLQDSLNTELGKILTSDQAAKLKAMGGKTFARKDPVGGPGGPGGRGPGGGGPGGGGGFGGGL